MSSNRFSPNAIIRPEFMPLSIARTIWKGKFLALAVALLVSGGTFLFVRKMPALYRANALILVDSQKIPTDYVSSTVRISVQDRLATISRQILSTERLRKLIQEMNLYPGLGKNIPDGVVDGMRANITVDLDKSYTGVLSAFRVSYTGPNPRMVADVANRLASFFVEENLKEREVQAEGTAEFIDAQLKEAKAKLDELENTLAQYKVRHSGELPQQQVALVGSMGRLQAELQANAAAIERARQNKLVLENSLDLANNTFNAVNASWQSTVRASQAPPPAAGDPKPAATAPVLIAAPRVNPEIEKLEAQLVDLRLRYSDEHPDVKRAKARLERLQSMEAAQERQQPVVAQTPTQTTQPTTSRPQPQRQVVLREPLELIQARERVQGIKAQITGVAREIDLRVADERRLRGEMGAMQGRLDRLPIREQEMAQLMRDFEVSQKNYQGLLGKKLSADMATDLERRQKAERFTIVDPARVPGGPFKPNRQMLYLLGCALGLALGIGAAFVNEMRKGVLLGEWEFPANTVILGSLPRIQIGAPALAAAANPARRALWLLIPLIAGAGYFLKQRLFG